MTEDSLINESGIKRFAKPSNKQISPEFLDGLNDKIKILIIEAVTRCELNHRKTLMRGDV